MVPVNLKILIFSFISLLALVFSSEKLSDPDERKIIGFWKVADVENLRMVYRPFLKTKYEMGAYCFLSNSTFLFYMDFYGNFYPGISGFWKIENNLLKIRINKVYASDGGGWQAPWGYSTNDSTNWHIAHSNVIELAKSVSTKGRDKDFPATTKIGFYKYGPPGGIEYFFPAYKEREDWMSDPQARLFYSNALAAKLYE